MTSKSLEERDAKINELRGLLGEAKKKLLEYKDEVQRKDKQIQELQVKKQILNEMQRQYEERLLRYQKSLDEGQEQIEKHQRVAITATLAKEDLQKQINHINNLALKAFASTLSSSAIDQQCELEKCHQFIHDVGNSDIAKGMRHLSTLYAAAIKLKKDARLYAGKKENQAAENLEKIKKNNFNLELQLKKVKEEAENQVKKNIKQMENIESVKNKHQEEEINIEYVKQMIKKIFCGPKQTSEMALEVLARLIKLDNQDKKIIKTKLK